MIYSEVKYMPERSRIYLGSPTLTRMPGGAIIACHDYFSDEPGEHRLHPLASNQVKQKLAGTRPSAK